MKLVRTSQHSLRAANPSKSSNLSDFVREYRTAVRLYIDFLWSTRLEIKGRVLDVRNHEYDCPGFIPVLPGLELNTRLTARALKCASTQACGIVKAVLNKRLKDESRFEWLLAKKRRVSASLAERLSKPPCCPDAKNINCELNSIVARVGEHSNSFDLWLNLSALFNDTRGFSSLCRPDTTGSPGSGRPAASLCLQCYSTNTVSSFAGKSKRRNPAQAALLSQSTRA